MRKTVRTTFSEGYFSFVRRTWDWSMKDFFFSVSFLYSSLHFLYFFFTCIHTTHLVPKYTLEEKLCFCLVTSCLGRVYLSVETYYFSWQVKKKPNQMRGGGIWKRFDRVNSFFPLGIAVGHRSSRLFSPSVIFYFYFFNIYFLLVLKSLIGRKQLTRLIHCSIHLLLDWRELWMAFIIHKQKLKSLCNDL